MNQLNLLQEKLQSNVVSQEEQKALKGKRGRIFRKEYSNQGDTANDYSSTKTNSGGSTTIGSSTSSSTIGVSSSSATGTSSKFDKGRII